MNGNDDPRNFARGADGRLLRDRYGRPIQRRHAQPQQERPSQRQETQFLHQGDPRFPPPGYNPDQPWPYDASRNESQVPVGVTGRGSELRRDQRRRDIPRRRNRRARRPFGIRRTLRALFLVAVLVIAGGLAFVELSLNRTQVFASLNSRPSGSMATNWLLVGSDSRAGISEEQAAELNTGSGDFGQRTDTIMIAHIPLVGKTKLVSIPRDSFVDIPGNGPDKINAAFAIGGPALLTDTVEKVTGIRIDHYAEIGFGGFAGIVDAAGGIEMCPTEAITDPLAGLDIQSGCQQFDGKGALGYVRTRATAHGDLDRVTRQRDFMGALMKRVSSPWVLLNPYRLIRVTNAGVGSLTVSEKDHSWNLSWLMIRLAMGVESLTVPTAGSMDTDYSGNVLLWDEAETNAFFRQLR